jgi:glutathione S-transferase
MKLYVASASPFGRKASITIAELGLESRVRQEPATVTPVTRNEEVARDNPLGKIPTLVLDDGSTLFDSPVICEYLDSLSGEPRFFPQSGPARWSALRRQALADGLMDAAILLRYEQALRPEPLRWADWMSGQQAKSHGSARCIRSRCAVVRRRLRHRACHHCVRARLPRLRFGDLGWRNGRPALAAWFTKVSERPSLISTFPKVST